MKDLVSPSTVSESTVVSPTALEVGSGFSARQFRHSQFAGLMDPLLMVDDYTMTEPTFGAHAHGGISAVSLLFEDSRGDFLNQDSLGNNLTLGAGDLYWLSAGRGAMHDESPRSGRPVFAACRFLSNCRRDWPTCLPSHSTFPAPACPLSRHPAPGYAWPWVPAMAWREKQEPRIRSPCSMATLTVGRTLPTRLMPAVLYGSTRWKANSPSGSTARPGESRGQCTGTKVR